MAKRTPTPRKEISDPAQASREKARAKNAAARAQRNRLAAADLELRRVQHEAQEREREERKERIEAARAAGSIELEEAIGLLASIARAADADSTRVSSIALLAKLKGWGGEAESQALTPAQLEAMSPEELAAKWDREALGKR